MLNDHVIFDAHFHGAGFMKQKYVQSDRQLPFDLAGLQHRLAVSADGE